MTTLQSGKLSPTKLSGVINWKTALRFGILGILVPLLPIIISGRLDWWQAWTYAVLTVVISLLSRYLLYMKDPELFAERARFTTSEGVKGWDKLLVSLIALVGPVVVLIVAGLDKRYVWTPDLAPWLQVGAFVVFLFGFGVSIWAMLVNSFFSSVVRIQKERGQVTISSGPYSYVRHPGYAGALVAWVVTPLIFNSVWTAIPTGVIVALYILRTALEDRTLHAELPGYTDYAARIRYRLLPRVW